VPGRWTVWVGDRRTKLESNRIEIPLRFTADSITACVEIALDKKQLILKRKWHAKWLQRFMPDLAVDKWWWYDTPLEEQKARDKKNCQELERFRVFWEDEKNAEAIDAVIARINREAGLEPATPEPQDAGPKNDPGAR
jgi:hypothetical protein